MVVGTVVAGAEKLGVVVDKRLVAREKAVAVEVGRIGHGLSEWVAARREEARSIAEL